VRIPGESKNGGADRLDFYAEVIAACFHSRTKRIQQYDLLRHYYLYGTGPESEPSPYNKIEPIVDTLTAFLYAADSTRFSAHLGPEVPPAEWEKVPAITKAINSEWMNSGADQIFGQALELATVYNSAFVKTIPNAGSTTPYVVEPHCFGVYREDLNGLDRQEAIAQRYYITRSQLIDELENHPSRDKILKSIAPKPLQPRDEMPESLRRIIITNMAATSLSGPLSPGQTVTGNGTLRMTERIDYTPSIAADVIEMTELWIRDDDLKDYRTVTMAEGNVVIYDRKNIFVNGEQPFTQVCPVPMHGYFWGSPLVGRLVGLQGWRNTRVNEIQRLSALEADPPVAATGFSGMADETVFALNQPGGIMNNSDPMGKVQRFDVKVPPDLWTTLGQIDEMFSEAAALPPLLMGRGETGVRSGRQTTELSRLGSSRIKKRALCVEDTLDTLATKIFRVLRKEDARPLMTTPMKPGEKPMKFILNQAPEQLLMKVDAHSNSPLFIEDQKALAAELLESRSIDRESFIDMLNPPMKDMLLRKLPLIEAKEQAAAKAAADHETQMAQAKHAPGGAAPGAVPGKPGG